MSDNIPELVLEMPEAEDKRVAASTYDEELSRLSEKEQETVKQFSKQIDVTQTSVIMRYGKIRWKRFGQRIWEMRERQLQI